MRALAEEYGWVVGGIVLLFLLPPILGFLTFAWTKWIGLWVYFFGGKSRSQEPKVREDHDDTTRLR